MNIQDWFLLGLTGLLVVQETLRHLLHHHSLKASILQCPGFFMVQFSYPYMTTGKTITLTIWTFVGKVMSLLFNMLSRFIVAFLPRSKWFLISWLWSLSAVSYFGAQENKAFIADGKELLKKSGVCSIQYWDNLRNRINEITINYNQK